MSKKGYGRVSSKGQERYGNSLSDQEAALLAAGCDEVVLEAYTGTKMDRPKFTALLSSLKAGDTLVVTKLDRFARTAADGVKVVEELLARGVSVHILNMGLIEDTPMGRLILTVMLAFAQFERDSIVERTGSGKAVARQREGYKEGRPRIERPDGLADYIAKINMGDLSVSAVCESLGVSRNTWYRWMKEVG